jgi:hypothetical protein
MKILTIQVRIRRQLVKNSKPKQSMGPNTVFELADTPVVIKGVMNLFTEQDTRRLWGIRGFGQIIVLGDRKYTMELVESFRFHLARWVCH